MLHTEHSSCHFFGVIFKGELRGLLRIFIESDEDSSETRTFFGGEPPVNSIIDDLFLDTGEVLYEQFDIL